MISIMLLNYKLQFLPAKVNLKNENKQLKKKLEELENDVEAIKNLELIKLLLSNDSPTPTPNPEGKTDHSYWII